MSCQNKTVLGMDPHTRKIVCRYLPAIFVALLLLCSCSGGIYHTVKPGQTLYRISRSYGVAETTIARVNHISDPTRLRAGTRLYIPGADRVRYVPIVKSAPAAKAVTPPPVPKKAVSSGKKSTIKSPPSPRKKKPVQQRPAKATMVKKLQWPLRGKIVHSFSTVAKAGGGKGIEIAVRSGTAVTAAEAGKVIYGGDGVQGYGQLIILQHENDLFTVYGFNQRLYVRQGDFVSKGEKIALSGIPPAGGTPRLHFEVRKGKVAVNPILYLP
ncbi:MAG: peptidoglycan DD-metalloendopeptidase family protein [Desulfuromonadales bacterium]|nr:peptidoglycan DD-metalloendopeptidase family protein [Desulfuromonadales bacterium]